MDFLELQRDSRVTTGNSGCLLCWPREVQSSIRVVKESWGKMKPVPATAPQEKSHVRNWRSKGLQMVTATMKLEDAFSLEEKL